MSKYFYISLILFYLVLPSPISLGHDFEILDDQEGPIEAPCPRVNNPETVGRTHFDAQLNHHFNKTKQLFDLNQPAAALEVLQSEILDQPEMKIRFDQELPGYSRLRANQIVATLRPELKKLYRLQYESAAKKLLDQAVTDGDIQTIAELSSRFPNTLAGQEALMIYASYLLDTGKTIEAFVMFKRLLYFQQLESVDTTLTQHYLTVITAAQKSQSMRWAFAQLTTQDLQNFVPGQAKKLQCLDTQGDIRFLTNLTDDLNISFVDITNDLVSYDFKTAEKKRVVDGINPFYAAQTEDYKTLYYLQQNVGNENALQRLDLVNGKRELIKDNLHITYASPFNNNRDYFFTVTDGSLNLLNLASGSINEIKQIGTPIVYNLLIVSEDHTRAAYVQTLPNQSFLTLVDLPSGTELTKLVLDFDITYNSKIFFLKQNYNYIVLVFNGGIYFWDTLQNKLSDRVDGYPLEKHAYMATFKYFDATNQLVFITDRDEGYLTDLSAIPQAPTFEFLEPAKVNELLSPHPEVVFEYDQDKKIPVDILDRELGQAFFNLGDQQVRFSTNDHVRFSEDRRFMLSFSKDTTALCVWYLSQTL